MNRKKRILFCSEATFLNTGYATYTREIINYINSTKKYDIAELGCYASPDDPRCNSIPWKFYPAALPRKAPKHLHQAYNSRNTNQFGEFVFSQVCLDFKPDIVCDIRDFWMIEFAERSPFRKFFKWCIMPTVDASPQATNWINTFKSADACLSYSDWAGEILNKQSNGNIKYFGSAPPSADEAYSCAKEKEDCRKLIGLPADKKVIGTVMRNQRRKLYPDLFNMFKKILLSSSNPSEYILYCHTSYPDMGWDIPSLLIDSEIASSVYFTYVCQETKKPYASTFNGPCTLSPFTEKMTGVLPSVQNGVSYDDLSNIINCFDIYVQYANSEGFGLPQVEAAAGGVPVAAVDYSAMHSVIRQLEGIPLKVKALYKEMETGCMRAVPDNDASAKDIKNFLDKTKEEKELIGFRTKQNFLKHFQWEKSGSMWEKCFDSFEIEPTSKTWFSSPSILMPDEKPDEDIIESWSSIEKAVFIISNVLKKPEKLYSDLFWRIVKDMNYGFTTSSMHGIYLNDSSMINEGSIRKNPFNFDIAYSTMYSARMEINKAEEARKEAFNL